MRIGIDARLIEETGVGRYIRNLIAELTKLDKDNEYVVFLREKSYASFQPPNSRWQKRLAEVAWHTLTEQLVMPQLLSKERLDLVHIPYHNPPIFYAGKTVITIHDLTILHFDTGKATTLPLPLYKLKRVGYWIELAIGLRRAEKIIAVSQTTKQKIIDHFHVPENKIVVIYEGIDQNLSRAGLSRRLIKDRYFLYVGNAYPHKNLEMLLQAFKMLITYRLSLIANLKLILVGKDDFFYRRLKERTKEIGLADSVLFFGSADDAELHNLYRHAIALVFPSLMEGHGLPGIEAMAVGTPVVCSDIPVFREIYGDAYIPFNPLSPDDLADKLKRITVDNNLRKTLIEKGKKQAVLYSWRRMAEQTLQIYESCVRV